MKKTLFLLIGLLLGATVFSQNNPYAIFGHQSKVVYETKIKEYLYILNSDTTSSTYALAFNFEDGQVLFLDKTDSILSQVKIDPSQLYRWLSVDPLASDYPSLSPYNFVANNPLNAIDPDGRKIIFVNGYYNTGDGTMPRYISKNVIGTVGGEGYWSSSFISGAKTFFNDQSTGFVDGRGAWNSTGEERFNAGYAYAKANLSTITAGMVEGETVKIVSHSMGAAYAEGMIKYLQEQNIAVEKVVHLSAADPSGFSAHNSNTLQLNLENDIVLGYKNFGENNMISGVTRYGEVNTERGYFSDLANSHADTKFDAGVWNMVRDLENIQMNFTGNTSKTINIGDPSFGPSMYQTLKWGNYNSTGNTFGTQFNTLNINGSNYSGGSSSNTYTGPAR
ncbi:MAG: hypothetical protein QY303_05265 [Vicingaceae bacterium]|nr:MAG: hypothetical protein QY303_05265 [Vicingaceae bacterium]